MAYVGVGGHGAPQYAEGYYEGKRGGPQFLDNELCTDMLQKVLSVLLPQPVMSAWLKHEFKKEGVVGGEPRDEESENEYGLSEYSAEQDRGGNAALYTHDLDRIIEASYITSNYRLFQDEDGNLVYRNCGPTHDIEHDYGSESDDRQPGSESRYIASYVQPAAGVAGTYGALRSDDIAANRAVYSSQLGESVYGTQSDAQYPAPGEALYNMHGEIPYGVQSEAASGMPIEAGYPASVEPRTVEGTSPYPVQNELIYDRLSESGQTAKIESAHGNHGAAISDDGGKNAGIANDHSAAPEQIDPRIFEQSWFDILKPVLPLSLILLGIVAIFMLTCRTHSNDRVPIRTFKPVPDEVQGDSAPGIHPGAPPVTPAPAMETEAPQLPYRAIDPSNGRAQSSLPRVFMPVPSTRADRSNGRPGGYADLSPAGTTVPANPRTGYDASPEMKYGMPAATPEDANVNPQSRRADPFSATRITRPQEDVMQTEQSRIGTRQQMVVDR